MGNTILGRTHFLSELSASSVTRTCEQGSVERPGGKKGRSKAVLWEPDLVQVLEAAEGREMKELGGAAAQALRQLLTQLLGSQSQQPPTEAQREGPESAGLPRVTAPHGFC
ncbi:hypothetical protein SKAU_G00294240 [Synaphobranchus kaupii]|uniref:Uncharacterized protein n=1 Tax=Synaphobranchus kaupii TaxID=118154 RepID=A0A9Q1EUD0_SYNKA|nr:hypothetical protein SKAU_G00294240 [Synaphobranchus kaupii]